MKREEAISMLEQIGRHECIWMTCRHNEVYETIDKAIKALKEQRPHGEWTFVGDNLFQCTHCGYVANADYLRDWKVYKYDAEFPTACPKCGADMRVKDELNRVSKELNSEIEKSKSEIVPDYRDGWRLKEGE